MLGGFVIRRFIGTWVLLIKSLGLVYLPQVSPLITVPRSSLWVVARKGRSSNSRRMLLRKLLHQILRNIPNKRR